MLAVLLVVLVGPLLLLLALLFTSPGTQWLLNRLDGLDVLDVRYSSGALLGDLRLQRLAVNVEGVEVVLDTIALQLKRECLWRSEFCFHYLNVEDLRVSVDDSVFEDEESGEAAGAESLIELPYPLESADLRVDHLLVSWPGGSWEQGELRGAARFAASTLHVSKASLATAHLWVGEGEDGGDGDEGYTGFEPTRVFLPLNIQARDVRLAQGSMSLAGWESELGPLELAGQWRGTRLDISGLQLERFSSGELAIERIEAPGFLDFRDQWPIGWRFSGQVAAPTGDAGQEGRHLQLGASGDFAGLQLELASPGEPELTLGVTADIRTAGLPFTASGSLAWPAPLALGAALDEVQDEGLDVDDAPEALAALQVDEPLRFSLAGDLTHQSLTLQARASGFGYTALQLQGAAVLEASLLRIEQLRLEDAASDSELDFSGELRLGAGWSLAGTASSEGFELPGDLLPGEGRLQGRIGVEAQGADGAWELRLPEVDLDGTFGGLPARLTGYAGIAADLQALPSELDGNVNGAQLRLRLSGDMPEQDSLRIDVDDLGRWVDEGRGSLALRAEGKLTRGDIRLDGEARDITVGELDMPEAAFTGAWRRDEQSLQLRFNAARLDYVGRHLEALELALDATRESQRARLSFSGELASQLQVEGSLSGEQWHGTLAPLRLDTRSGTWELAQAVALEWQRDTEVVNIAPHCWQHPDFELCAARARLGAAGDVQLRLTGDVSAFNGLLPPDLRAGGALETSLDAAWGSAGFERLVAQGQASDIVITREFGLGESASLSWDRVRLGLHRRDNRLLALEGSIEREGRRVFSVNATLPPERDGELAGELALDTIRLSALTPWTPLFEDLGGALTGQLRLGGRLDSPLVFGELSLSEGQALLEGNPTELSDFTMQVGLEGQGGSLRGSGLLGGGAVRLDGDFRWQPDFGFQLNVEGEEQNLLIPPSSEILVSEKLRLAYSGDTLDLGGDVHINGGLLRHEELPEGGVALSKDVVEVDAAGEAISEPSLFLMNTDLWLYIDDGFEVRSDTLQAYLGGKLHLLEKAPAPPQLFGSLGIAGGELRVYRQRLEIRRGTVDFTGPLQNPALDVSAERRIRADNVTVGAHLFGPLETPQLEIYSDPPMGQGEAMSYLIRGRGLDAGAGADGTALALAVGADVVNRSGVVEGLNRLPLINNVAFGSSGDEDETAATLGGYLGDRIYMSYGVGLYEPINEFTARLYLQSSLWLEVVSRLENSVDLYYSFDID